MVIPSICLPSSSVIVVDVKYSLVGSGVTVGSPASARTTGDSTIPDQNKTNNATRKNKKSIFLIRMGDLVFMKNS
jgi:hypothetical protein